MINDLLFLSAQPHDQYFQWQVEVQITNFRKFGISNKMHILVWVPKGSKELNNWANLQKKYPEARFFVYPDKGVDLGLYVSQLRPHIIKEHYKRAEMQNRNVFYHDSDILFNYLPDFDKLLTDDIVYQSNTTGYLDYTYLSNKEREGKIPDEKAIRKFAEIGGITVDTIKSYDRKTGGAQTLLKNVDSDFWQDVEDQCIAIRKAFYYDVPGSINRKYFKSENAGFQSWCADMWALNFALWKRGIKTEVVPELDFSWATDNIETYKKKPIYHNAGATGRNPNIFYKSKWIKESPIGKEHDVDPDSASSMYVKAINEVL